MSRILVASFYLVGSTLGIMGEYADQLSAVPLTAKQLLRKHERINEHFIELRDKGAIINTVLEMLKECETELNRRKIRW